MAESTNWTKKSIEGGGKHLDKRHGGFAVSASACFNRFLDPSYANDSLQPSSRIFEAMEKASKEKHFTDTQNSHSSSSSPWDRVDNRKGEGSLPEASSSSSYTKRLVEDRRLMEELRRQGCPAAGSENHGDILAGSRNLDVKNVRLDRFKQRQSNDLPFDRFMAEQDHQIPGRFYPSDKK